MQQWLLGDGEHHGGQGGTWDFFGRRNRVFGLRRYSHVAFDKEPLKADAGCRATYQVDHAPAPPLPAALVDRAANSKAAGVSEIQRLCLRPPYVSFSRTAACGSSNRQVKVAEYFTDGSGPTGEAYRPRRRAQVAFRL